MTTHRMEFFVMCCILAERIMHDPKFLREIAPEIERKYSRRAWAFKALVKELFAYLKVGP